MTTSFHDQLFAALGDAYRVTRDLGGGGMSRVFLAEETALQRQVVLKVLAPSLAEGISAERFAREVRFAATLQHPHIVPLLSAGTAGDLPYYVMPFVDGESLRSRLANHEPMSAREAVPILRDIAKALEYAHTRGIVHRDIKPENILLAGNTAVVTDFGIAKAISASRSGTAESALTRVGTSLGTPAYMAPEQIAGDPIDPRADIYAWGVVAYEMLAGRHPFAEKTLALALMSAHLTERPTALGDVRSEVAPPLAALVMRALEKDPGRRPQTAGELLSTLETLTTPEWLLTAPSTRHERTERTFRLTDRVVRQLNRDTLDPRIIGREMQYAENNAPTDVLVFCLHGLGSNHGEFDGLLTASPYRTVAVTLFGFEPEATVRIPLRMEDHVALMRELLRAVAAHVSPRRIVLAGFSSGADVMLRLVSTPDEHLPIDGVLALGPNLAYETCFASRVLARLHVDAEPALLQDLGRMTGSAQTLGEWLNIAEYLVRALRTFRRDAGALRVFAADIARPFEQRGQDQFVESYRNASEHVGALRCIFESSETCIRLVQGLRLRNLDTGLLGPRYREETLHLEPDTNHFDLLEPARIMRHLDALLSDCS